MIIKKRSFAVLFLLLTVILSMNVFAGESKVYDNAGLFTEEEKQGLEESVNDIINDYSIDFVILTINDAQGMSAERYANNYYDEMDMGIGSGRDGVLFLMDMDNRQIYLITNGKANDLMGQKWIDKTLDKVIDKMKSQEYYQTAKKVVRLAKNELSNWSVGKTIVAVAVPLLVFIIGTLIVKNRYQKPPQMIAYPLQERSDLKLTGQQDQFITRTITQRKIQTSSSSGKGSSRSSSGGGRSGGGRSF